MTHLLNSATFQIWLAFIIAGVVATILTRDSVYATLMPWGGLFTGVAYNELTPGFLSTGFVELIDDD